MLQPTNGTTSLHPAAPPTVSAKESSSPIEIKTHTQVDKIPFTQEASSPPIRHIRQEPLNSSAAKSQSAVFEWVSSKVSGLKNLVNAVMQGAQAAPPPSIVTKQERLNLPPGIISGNFALAGKEAIVGKEKSEGRIQLFGGNKERLGTPACEVTILGQNMTNASAIFMDLNNLAQGDAFGWSQIFSEKTTVELTALLAKRVADREGFDCIIQPPLITVNWEVIREDDGRIIFEGRIKAPIQEAITSQGEMLSKPGSLGAFIRIDPSNWTAEVKEEHDLIDAWTQPNPLINEAFHAAFPENATAETRLGTNDQGQTLIHQHITYEGLNPIMTFCMKDERPAKQAEIDGRMVDYAPQLLTDAARRPAHFSDDLLDAPLRNALIIDGVVTDFSDLELIEDQEERDRAIAERWVAKIWEHTGHDPEVVTLALSWFFTQGPDNRIFAGPKIQIAAIGREDTCTPNAKEQRKEFILSKNAEGHEIAELRRTVPYCNPGAENTRESIGQWGLLSTLKLCNLETGGRHPRSNQPLIGVVENPLNNLLK